MSDKKDYRLQTRLIHGQFRSKKWDYNHQVVPPMSQSATFRLEGASRGATGFFRFACDRINPDREVPIYIYDRLDEPTRGMLEENLAEAEGAEACVCFATGMAAISAALGVLCQAGDEIVAHRVLYGCTYSLMQNWLPRMGIKTTFVDFNDPDAVKRAITPKTRVLYAESPVNPNLELVDLERVRALLGDAEDRPQLVVDNTFATPWGQRPMSLGADVVVHSLTKGLGGFGTDMGGAVLTREPLRNLLLMYRKDFGGALSAKAAWTFLVHGLPTLATRMSTAQKTAGVVAEWLQAHPRVKRVSWPGLASFPQRALAEKQLRTPSGEFAPGTMIYFEIDDPEGDGERGGRMMDWIAQSAYSITLAVSLGQVKTLIEHPYSMTHSALSDEDKRKGGLHPGGIRLSIGLEDPADLIADLEAALAHA
ncbi:MAG: aminotransferase class I/II-fold pyridoxal phosphate-dependent enzyme [Myxococcaceae bacterium]|nr:aminotransferase class I/II-fold pyridoxal phosphate-dependent enzyme [Myxococcaceae bacterium]